MPKRLKIRPGIRLRKLNDRVNSIVLKMMELIVISKIVTERLGITNEEIQLELQNLRDKNKESSEGSSIQSPETGTDEGHLGAGEP